MSIGVRQLSVLGEFEPFGLTAESSDGDLPAGSPDHYQYFLFNPEITRDRDDVFAPDRDFMAPAPSSICADDHELFIRGNRIIWTMGSRVYKRYSSPNTVLMISLAYTHQKLAEEIGIGQFTILLASKTPSTISHHEDFCSQVLFECVSKDRPALLQVYLSLYTMIGSMWEQLNSGHIVFHDTCFLSSLKLALAYNDALMCGKLTCSKGGIIQSTFMESLKRHIEEILTHSQRLKVDFVNYINSRAWPDGPHCEMVDAMLLSWYLQWYGVPPPHVVISAVERIKAMVPTGSTVLPLLRLLLPAADSRAIAEIDNCMFFSRV